MGYQDHALFALECERLTAESVGTSAAIALSRMARWTASKPNVRQRIRRNREERKPKPLPHLLGHWPKLEDRRRLAKAKAGPKLLRSFFERLDARSKQDGA